jgi:hypothetical protein
LYTREMLASEPLEDDQNLRKEENITELTMNKNFWEGINADFRFTTY